MIGEERGLTGKLCGGLFLLRAGVESGGASEHGTLVFCRSQVPKPASVQGEQPLCQQAAGELLKPPRLNSVLCAAPPGQQAGAARPRRGDREPPPAAAGGHPHRHLLLRPSTSQQTWKRLLSARQPTTRWVGPSVPMPTCGVARPCDLRTQGCLSVLRGSASRNSRDAFIWTPFRLFL